MRHVGLPRRRCAFCAFGALVVAGVVGCGGKSVSEANADVDVDAGHGSAGMPADAGAMPGAAGAPSRLPRSCEGSLQVKGMTAVELECEKGVVAIGGGMFRLALGEAGGSYWFMNLPSVEAGTYSDRDCVTAAFSLEGVEAYFLCQELDFAEAGLSLVLTREGDLVHGELGGRCCDYVSDDGSGQPGAVCVEAKMVFDAPIDLPSRSCVCGMAAPQSGCSVPVCGEGTCASLTCPAGAAVCTTQ